jgi:hypothetical protein
LFNAQGWSIGPDPDNEANMVVIAKQGAPWTWYDRENINLNNAVLRLRYKYNGNAVSHINFRFVEIPGMDARYMYVTGAYSHLQRINTGTTIGLANFPPVSPDTWHQLEMGYFDGVLSIYLDGKPLFENTDPQPWEGGSINLEPYPQNESEMFLYDNISLCELSAPMETLFVEAP